MSHPTEENVAPAIRAAWATVAIVLLFSTCTPASPTTAPAYTRDMWLADSLLTCDLIASGTPEQNGEQAFLKLDKVVHGDPAKALTRDPNRLTLSPPYRCTFGKAGLWLLLRTPRGYFILNPDTAPLPATTALQPPNWKLHDLTADESAVTRRLISTDSAGRPHERIITTTASDAGIATEVILDNKRILQRGFDESGALATLFRLDDHGDGFNLAYESGQLYSYTAYRNGKRDGLSREFFRYKPDQLREEIHWEAGLRQGRCRTWDENGQLLTDITYEHGLIAPVIRYTGPRLQQPIVSMYTTDAGVFYKARSPLESLIKPGMSAAEVSALLKVDVSPQSGLTFPLYTPRRLLHIAFKDGRVSMLRLADNSACFDPAGSTGGRK